MSYDATAAAIRKHEKEWQSILKDLEKLGPKLIKELSESTSLREVARQSGLSASYLSKVRNAEWVIGSSAFLLLLDVRARRAA